MRIFVKTAIVIIAQTPFLLFSQTLPVAGLVNPVSTRNILSNVSPNSQSFQLTNTSTIALKFCMSPSASASCLSSGAGLTVNAGQTVTATVGELGGVSLGTF